MAQSTLPVLLTSGTAAVNQSRTELQVGNDARVRAAESINACVSAAVAWSPGVPS